MQGGPTASVSQDEGRDVFVDPEMKVERAGIVAICVSAILANGLQQYVHVIAPRHRRFPCGFRSGRRGRHLVRRTMLVGGVV